MKETSKNTGIGMALGMCFGVSIGTALGSAFNNLAIGTTLGLSVGMALGLAFGALKDSKVNSQLEKEGYTVKAVEPDEGGNRFAVTIVSKAGTERVFMLNKEQMEEQAFVIGDLVYLNEDGEIEQAYEKEDS